MWNILVVDDNFFNRKLLVEILKDKANCDIAANAEEALEAYTNSVTNTKPYDVILLDIAMPGESGLDVLTKIRKEEESRGIKLGKGIPIIMVTAHKEPLFSAFDRGCDDYIVKPVCGDSLIAKIAEKVGS